MTTIEAFRDGQKRQHGSTLAERLRLFLTWFAKRPDVYVYGNWNTRSAETKPTARSFGKPLSVRSVESLAKKGVFPLEVVAFMSEMKEVSFQWDFADRTAGVTRLGRGSNGGALRLVELKSSSWHPRPSYDADLHDYAAYAVFDRAWQEEGRGEIAHADGEARADAQLWFASASGERVLHGSLEAYLTLGARRAFTPSWQSESWPRDGQRVFEELRGRSSPVADPSALAALLVERGCPPVEAGILTGWLGADAAILVFEG